MTHVCARTSRTNFETKIVRQSQEIKQEEVEVKVPGDKNPRDVFRGYYRDIFTIDEKSMKLTVEDEWTREAGLETGAAILTKFMGQPVTSKDDVAKIKVGLGDEKPAEWVFTFNRVSYI
jgi:hypothetical protein